MIRIEKYTHMNRGARIDISRERQTSKDKQRETETDRDE